jgi:hypothetical protein
MSVAVPRPAALPGLAALRGRHFFTDQDYTREELLSLLDLAAALKALYRRRPLTPFLEGRSLAMIFEHPSTRTRIRAGRSRPMSAPRRDPPGRA